jgi:two-component system, NtrC family, response regulator GlrR
VSNFDEEVDLSALEPGSLRTEPLQAEQPAVRRFEITGIAGPAAAVRWVSAGTTCAIGSHPGNEITVDDPSISRSHCELRVEHGQIKLHDLDSTNGTILDGVRISAAFVRDGSVIQIGRSTLRVTIGADDNRLAVSSQTRFGSLVGTSWAMRACFALLERAAASEITVLLEGESGTGKEGAAEALHQASPRRAHPFIVIDCGAIPANLLESELFGHERGAFTGATDRRVGAFEAANGGTIFLDEIGEMPSELQPKLLRVLERREVRRLGSNTVIPVDVRIVAATNRDLRAEVNATRFRSDLYFRLAVMKIQLPALRLRPDDLPVLVERIVGSLGVGADVARRLMAPAFVASLSRGAWPGNVRELRNYLERAAVLDDLAGGETSPAGSVAAIVDDAGQPYQQARDRVLAEFERRYVEQLLRAHHGNVSAAARASGIDRTYLHRLMRRHGLR